MEDACCERPGGGGPSPAQGPLLAAAGIVGLVPVPRAKHHLTDVVAGAIVGLVLVGRFLLNPLFRLLAESKAREVMTAAATLGEHLDKLGQGWW